MQEGQLGCRQLQQMAHELLSRVERAYDAGAFEGSEARLFQLVDREAGLRPVRRRLFSIRAFPVLFSCVLPKLVVAY